MTLRRVGCVSLACVCRMGARRLAEGGQRMMEWLRARVAPGSELESELELDMGAVVVQPQDSEIEALFALRREAAALHFALADTNLRRPRLRTSAWGRCSRRRDPSGSAAGAGSQARAVRPSRTPPKLT